MISLLHIISDTNIGGGGQSLLGYLSVYDRSRFSPSVILPKHSALTPRLQALNIPVYEIDAMADKSFDRSAIPMLTALIRQINPQLVHTHGSLTGRIAARMTGKKVVYTKHCAFAPTGLAASPLGWLAGRLISHTLSDGVIAVGHSAREILLASGVPDRQIHVLYNGVAPLPCPTEEQRQTARSSFGFQPDQFVLGILARVEIYKGHSTILQAVKQLYSEGRNIRLLVAGDGGYLSTLKEEAASLPSDVIHFAGFVSPVNTALYAMDVQLNASYESETSSLSLLEGMSIGLPSVVSNCCGNPYLVRNGENGLVFPMEDSAALAAAIAQLMDDLQTMEKMCANSRRIFTQTYTDKIFAENIEAVYTDVLKGVN